ncbi:MAG: DUF5675 family protein, partial [Salinivirgaceae bacterium]|nr:DUF5675 family protein [Salinivirgaceae bacterium]
MVWNTFAREFSEGRQSGERINLGLSFASFGQAKEDWSNMPVGRQFGFIFEQFDVASTIAHEVSHGAFSLHHTFSDESESYHAPQGTTPNLMDYSGGTTLNHLQWQWMHESHTNLLGFLADESEGESVQDNLLDKFVVLLNKVHSKNNANCEEYFKTIQNGDSNDIDIQFESKKMEKLLSKKEDGGNENQGGADVVEGSDNTTIDIEEEDNDDELKDLSDDDIKWLSEWKIRANISDQILSGIFQKIRDAAVDENIASITLNPKRVYIRKLQMPDGNEYNIAIYNNTTTKSIGNLKKVVVTDLEQLELSSIKKYLYVDRCKGYDYWLLSFVEGGKSSSNGKINPSLTIQISGSCTDNAIMSILDYLHIYMPLNNDALNTELRDICFSFNNKEYISSSDKIQVKKDHLIKVKSVDNIYKLCIYDDASKVQESGTQSALYSCASDASANNWVSYFMTSDLKECPYIVKEDDDNDYILEIVRAMRLARQKGLNFTRNIENTTTKTGEITLPNGKLISDITLNINAKNVTVNNKDEINVSEKDWLDLGKPNVTLGFGKKNGDKYPLEITCNYDCVDDLKNYVLNSAYNPDEIVIYITRTNTGEHSTTGTLVTDDGTISGYTVELPRGTDDECKTSCDDTSIPYDCYCIMEGTYDFEVNTKVYEEEKKQYLTNNSLRIISDIENGRDGVLVHKGSDDAKGWAKGCILPMPSRPIDNCKYGDYKVPPRI